MSIVQIERITAGRIYFTNVDMLDGSPLLDIKPYVTHFDCFTDARCGWLDKHFAGGRIPEATTKKNGS
jgi:tRNA (Thr-GGU) A37 N-methylase